MHNRIDQVDINDNGSIVVTGRFHGKPKVWITNRLQLIEMLELAEMVKTV